MDIKKKKSFVPCEQELEWGRGMLKILTVGNVWASSYALYLREAEDVLVCVDSSDYTKAPIYLTEKEVHRVSVTMRMLGMTFIDRRTKNN